ncbi:MAG: orotidine-5'-phosphate decarboxylase [Gammaproteobacteria bacterium]
MQTYKQRGEQAKNPVAKKCFQIMEEKKTNLCLSADVTTQKQLFELIEQCGPSICMVKTHVDILEDFTPDFPEAIIALAKKHNILIFEDRKFADIGNTVKHQYGGGIYKIAQWADIINAHIIPGPGIIEGLRAVHTEKQNALLLLAQMSSQGNLATGEYTQKTVDLAEAYDDFVIGFISQKALLPNAAFLHMTPGVNLAQKGDMLGQNYLTPKTVITEKGNDIIIVGRGIVQSDNPANTAKEYQQQGWQAYLDRCE